LKINFTQLVEIVHKVELIAAGKTGQEKEDIAVKLLNEAIDVPYIPDPIEEALFRYVVRAVVAGFNYAVGHDWSKLLKETE